MCCERNKGKAKCLAIARHQSRRAGDGFAPRTKWRTVRRLAQSDDIRVGEMGSWCGSWTDDGQHGQETVNEEMIFCHLWLS